VKIDIPGLLLKLRKEIVQANPEDQRAFRIWAWFMTRPGMLALAAKVGRLFLGFNIGPLAAWRSDRDFPEPPPKSFRDLWKERKK
jgi:L-lactate dehydrogenase complex protein LldF